MYHGVTPRVERQYPDAETSYRNGRGRDGEFTLGSTRVLDISLRGGSLCCGCRTLGPPQDGESTDGNEGGRGWEFLQSSILTVGTSLSKIKKDTEKEILDRRRRTGPVRQKKTCTP